MSPICSFPPRPNACSFNGTRQHSNLGKWAILLTDGSATNESSRDATKELYSQSVFLCAPLLSRHPYGALRCGCGFKWRVTGKRSNLSGESHRTTKADSLCWGSVRALLFVDVASVTCTQITYIQTIYGRGKGGLQA